MKPRLIKKFEKRFFKKRILFKPFKAKKAIELKEYFLNKAKIVLGKQPHNLTSALFYLKYSRNQTKNILTLYLKKMVKEGKVLTINKKVVSISVIVEIRLKKYFDSLENKKKQPEAKKPYKKKK